MERESSGCSPTFIVLSTILLVVACSASSVSQTDPALEAGLKPFGSYQAGDIDIVNTATGKLHVHIPLLSYPQLGGRLHLNYFIDYDSSSYSCQMISNHNYCTQNSTVGAWVKDDAIPHGTSTIFTTDNGSIYEGTLSSIVDPEGASHRMGALPSVSGYTTQLRALDASGYYMTYNSNWTSSSIYDSSGNAFTASSSGAVLTDTIGNYITLNVGNDIVDTIGRQIPTPPSNESTQGCKQWTVPAPNNELVPYTLCYEFQVGTSNLYLLTKVQLPNNTSYTFTYQTTTLTYPVLMSITDLIQIGLPTGGTISYTWNTVGSECNIENGWRWVQTRTVNDGVDQPWTWNYSFGQSGSGATFIIVDPLNNQAKHTSTELQNSQGTYEPCSLYETQYVQQDSSGHTLKTVTTSYQAIDDDGRNYVGYDVLSVVPTQVATTLNSGSSPQTVTTKLYSTPAFSFCDLASSPQYPLFEGGCTSGQQSTQALYIGNPSNVCVNDYGAGSGCTSSTLQKASYSYLAFQNGNYLNINLLNLKSQVQITSPLLNNNSSTTNYYYDDGSGSGPGLLTKIDKGLGAVYNKTYTQHGMLYQDIDPLSNATTYAYDSTGLFPQSVTNALSQKTQYSYDSNTGLVLSTTDPNSQTTTYTYDELKRPMGVWYPDGGSTQYSYNDVFPDWVQSVQWITQSITKGEVAWVDGLGRVTRTELATDPQGVDYMDTTYDGLGRKASLSTPYRSTSDPTYGVTYYQYDALNRVITQTQPDNSIIQSSYAGNQVTTTDEAGSQREAQTNALGWLTSIVEAPNVSGYNYQTTYGYDGLGNLVSVLENGSRTRSFVYDSLSRLTSASNPEVGTIGYQYDTTSTLTSKADGLGTITYTPDALHRLVSKGYSDGEPTLYYCYDGNQTACGAPAVSNGNIVGRRSGMGDKSGNTAWWYDSVGRVSVVGKTIAGYTSANTAYIYNLDGSVALVIYPSGDQAQYTYSGAGRVLEAAAWLGGSNSPPLASSITYTPDGQMSQYTNGDGEIVTKTYTNRLQLNNEEVSGSAGTILNWTYNFSPGHDNGNILGITNNLNSARSQAFTYDPLNRLATASFYGGSDQYGYDAWGNLLSKTVTGGSGESWLVTVDSNNHMNGYGYDGAGNLTSVNGVQYNTFNLENQWVSQSSYDASFLYDGDGKRVRRFESGISPETTYFWNDEGGNVLMETDSALNVDNLYFYVNGQRVAYGPALGNGGLYFYYTDHNGNVKMITNDSGLACYDADYFPFGGVINTWENSCPHQYYQFAGKDRDPVMGVDYFGARFYQDTMARFYSPDPLGGSLEDPQTLNRYTYVRNNPLRFTDPTGLYICGDSSNCSSKQDQAFEAARQNDLKSKNTDVVRAASAYGDVNTKNGTTVGFADLGKGGEGGVTVSRLGTDANGSLQAQSDVTINSNSRGTALDADVGHEGSHVADAQDMAASIHDITTSSFKVGDNISQYQSEQRAYGVTDFIYRSANEPYNGCGDAKCALGAGSSPIGIPGRIDAILLANPKIYHSPDGKPLTPANQGGNVLNLVVPH